MEVLEKENNKDRAGKIKEKVRVVALDDSTIIANTMADFRGNSNASVWSLCGLNSDDNHVDLGDISPSISPMFGEQQMEDDLTHRLMADDHIFSGERASNENTKTIPDLGSDLELFDQEMKSLESLEHGSSYIGRKGTGKTGGDGIQADVVTRRVLRKRGVMNSRGNPDSSVENRTRDAKLDQKRKGLHTAFENDGKTYTESKNKDVLKPSDVKEKPGKANEKKSEKAATSNRINESRDNKNNEQPMNVENQNNTLSELESADNELNKNEAIDGTGNESLTEDQIRQFLHSPPKRVTRSTTGNLKPKQTFEKLREERKKEELKRKEENKKKEQRQKDAPRKKKQKPASNDKEIDDAESSSSEDDELDFHEDDSDYSPEDDPDRPWCICRKPHGNKFMICCDDCEEWFHGKCVGVTMEQGRVMEKEGIEYVCDKCKEKKAKELMAEKAKELSEAFKTNSRPPDTTQEVQKKPTQPRQATPSVKEDVMPEADLKEKSQQTPVLSEEIKKRKVKEETGFRIPKKVRTTPTPVSHVHHVQAGKKCIMQGCPRSSFEGAVYCGRSCIERHVSEAIRMLTSKEHEGKLHTSEGNRVSMIEKSSGRLVAGMAAPVLTNLTDWILKNPSFQVLVSGTSPTSSSTASFYSKVNPDSKQKKETEKKSDVDTVRSNVRRTMKDILVERKKESSEIRISVEEILKLVAKIEDDMYKAFKDTSHRYKAKYRTLMFNLRDPRNKVLYRRVLTGDIPPEKLIYMTSDELATKELAQWREQETKHMIDMIRKEEENTNKARFIKKTHKGEVDMDGDEDLSTLETSNIKQEEEKKAKPEEKIEAAPIHDTTEEHRAHLFDLNCKICTGKMAPPGEIMANSPNMTNVPVQAAAESSIPSPVHDTYTAPLSPDTRETPSETSYPTDKTKETVPVWKGFVMMPSVAKFGSSAHLVSGSGDNLIQVLPDTLHVHGRIPHKHVWDYVKQCKTSSSRELCIIRFVASTEEEKISYVSMYSYFHSRKRCGVIGNCHNGVKDMYLVPLASHEPIPPQVLPFTGPGLQEPRPHMLLGLIVKNKNAPVKRSRPDRVPKSHEPPTKRPSVDDSKSSTSSSQLTPQPTPTKPSNSPVDEIEDIVFHYHNSQGGKPQPAQPVQPIPPMISTLLKIQEQEQKLLELQKQSERLEKELAPKMAAASSLGGNLASGLLSSGLKASSGSLVANQQSVLPAGNIASSLVPSGLVANTGTVVANPLSASNLAFTTTQSIAGGNVPFTSVDGTQNPNTFSTINVASSTALGIAGNSGTQQASEYSEDEPYDPEADIIEETPYDPEDLDDELAMGEEVPSPDKNQASTAVTAQSTVVTTVGNLGFPKALFVNAFAKSDSVVSSDNQPTVTQATTPQETTSEQQPSISKELEQKVQSLLKSEHLKLQTDLLAKATKEVSEREQRLTRSELERAHSSAPYHHSRDYPGEYHERRGEDSRFYSSRFSLRREDHRERHEDRHEHYRDYRDEDRHWDERNRRDDYYDRNRGDRSRDRWRR